MYAFMQATGLVNDHLVACPRWRAVQGKSRSAVLGTKQRTKAIR